MERFRPALYCGVMLFACGSEPAASKAAGGAVSLPIAGAAQAAGASPVDVAGSASSTGGAPSSDGVAGNSVGTAGESAAGSPGVRTRAKHEPEMGKTLLLIGQDTQEIESYASAFGHPGGVMLYTNVWDGLGVLTPSDFGGLGESNEQHWSTSEQPLALQVGLDLDARLDCGSCGSCRRAGHLEALANGGANESSMVGALADRFKASARPVFLRVGYEFDAEICPGGFGKYPSDAYREAFARVATIMRERGADNVALVWNAWAYQARDPAAVAAVAPWQWYPGDELVDWVALSAFPGNNEATEREQQDKRRQLAQFARLHQKPLMIAESTPRVGFAPSQGASAWNGWYSALLQYVEENDVKALSYINMDWEALPGWSGQGWGDTRIQNSPLAMMWASAIASDRWLLSTTNLYRELGFR